MKKFKVTVTNTKEVEVEIDETEMTEAWMAEFRRGFSNLTTIKQHAERIGRIMALGVQSSGDFIEGYGYLRTEADFHGLDYSYQGRHNPDAPRMNINIREIAEGCETDIEERI